MKQLQIESFIKEVEHRVLNSRRTRVSFEYNWTKGFTDKPGIYGVYDKGKLVYVGETANLKARMKEFKRTYNHSLRRLLGVHLFNEKKGSNGKFEPHIEEKLDKYYKDYLEIVLVPVDFGRLEIESYLIRKYERELLNKNQKRGNLAV